MAQAGATGCTITWSGCWTFGPRNGREQPVENGSSTSSGDGLSVAVRVPEKSLHFVLFERLRRDNQAHVGSEHVRENWAWLFQMRGKLTGTIGVHAVHSERSKIKSHQVQPPEDDTRSKVKPAVCEPGAAG